MELSTLSMLFAMGLAGGLHCAGMCGPLAVLSTVGRRRFFPFLLYSAGKSSSYVLMGALVGALGETVVRAAPVGAGSRILAVGGGLLLAAVALDSLGLFRGRLSGLGWLSAVSGFLAGLAKEGGAAGSLLLGGANGFLPCPMVYGFLALAAATASPIRGAATMLVLGITTALPLAVCALAGYRLTRLKRVPVLNGVFMLAVAALMLYRGLAVGGPAHCH